MVISDAEKEHIRIIKIQEELFNSCKVCNKSANVIQIHDNKLNPLQTIYGFCSVDCYNEYLTEHEEHYHVCPLQRKAGFVKRIFGVKQEEWVDYMWDVVRKKTIHVFHVIHTVLVKE